jgi:hypothetical protein
MPQDACMPEVTLTVPGYGPARGAVIQPEGGDVQVRYGESGVEILADPAGLRDLALWCLVLARRHERVSAETACEVLHKPLTHRRDRRAAASCADTMGLTAAATVAGSGRLIRQRLRTRAGQPGRAHRSPQPAQPDRAAARRHIPAHRQRAVRPVATGPGQRAGTRSRDCWAHRPAADLARMTSGTPASFEASAGRLKLVVTGYRPGREMARPGRLTPVTCAPGRYRSE